MKQNSGSLQEACMMAVVLAFSQTAVAQLEEIVTKQPTVQAGQLFSVKVVPKVRRFEIYVAGNGVADVNVKDVSLTTSLKSGQRIWSIEPTKRKDYFLIRTPSDLPSGTQPDLRVQVNYQDKTEDFRFKVDPVQRSVLK